MDELTNFYKLLSDETRLRILMLLKQKPLCVCQLYGIMGESQPKISKHLGKLRDMGIIQSIRKEQFTYYSLKTDNVLYLETLNNIFEKVDNYPVLKKDFYKINDAESFLNSQIEKEV